MKELLYYILKVILCSAVLYGYYHFALRNKKFHLYNRYYLLIAAFLSITIPFLNIPVHFASEHGQPSIIFKTLTAISPGYNPPIQTADRSVAHTPLFTLENTTRLFYLLIASILFLRFLHAMLHIKQLLCRYPVQRIDNIYFVNTEEPGTPFSFFKWLFWNKKIDLQSETGEQIFRHELFHIEQKHSWDVIILEILTAALWINPFFHLIKKEIKTIHEFLADEFATMEKDKWNYAELLLMEVLGSHNNRLVNSFFHNQIKRRIAMITSFQKTSHRYMRKIMVLPVTIFVIALFAFKYKKIKSNEQKKVSFQAQMTSEVKKFAIVSDTVKLKQLNINNRDTVKPLEGVLFVIDGKQRPDIKSASELDSIVKPEDIRSINVLKGPVAKYGEKGKKGVIEIFTKVETVNSNMNVDNRIFEKVIDSIKQEWKTPEVINENKNDNIIFEKVEIDASFPGGEEAWRNFLSNNLNRSIPADNGAPGGSYSVWLQFIVDKQGNISDIRPLTNYGYGMEEECLRVMKLSPKWNPAKQNGHTVKAYRKQPIIFISRIPTISSADLKKITVASLLKLPPDTKITSFLFTIDTDTGYITEAENKGNEFSLQTKSLLQNAGAGRIITIDNILIYENGRERQIPGRIYGVLD